MKRFVSVMLFTTCLLTLSPGVRGQDCSNWNNWDLRGTYTLSGSGWIDLSKLDPNLPPGTIPMSWVGVHTLNGRGGGTGWVSVNAGGVQFNAQLIGLTYTVQADCSVLQSFSMKIKELGGMTLGPLARLSVIAGNHKELELHGIFVGAGPGMPVDLFAARRISTEE